MTITDEIGFANMVELYIYKSLSVDEKDGGANREICSDEGF